MGGGLTAAEIAEDLLRHLGVERGRFGAFVRALDARGAIVRVPRRELGGGSAALTREYGAPVILLAGDVRPGRWMRFLVAHELAEWWLRGERHDALEADCNEVAAEMVRTRSRRHRTRRVARGQLRLAI
jgi:hypothetical protein